MFAHVVPLVFPLKKKNRAGGEQIAPHEQGARMIVQARVERKDNTRRDENICRFFFFSPCFTFLVPLEKDPGPNHLLCF